MVAARTNKGAHGPMSDTPTRNQRAIETTGAVDEAGRLHLDEPLDGAASRAVRVLVLFDVDDEEMGEQAWLRAASRNPAFEFLNDPEEDLYTAEDGAPFEEEPESNEET